MILAQAIVPRRGAGAGAPPAADPVHVLVRASRRSRAVARETGFWRVWLIHRAYLQGFSLRFSGGNAADAEDALSEAMLKAAAAFETATVQNPRAWLLRLVHNACMDRHRGHRRQHRIAEVAGHGDGCPFPIVRPPLEPSPEDLLSAAQSDSELVQALGTLPRALAEPLRLHLDDRPDAEIAARLNVTKEVVRKRRQLAKDFLRRRLAE